jgi:hypothetical protein
VENKSEVSVTIVNRYYPPNKSAIAEAANDLAIFLIENGCQVKIVHTDGDYPGGGETGKKIKGEQHIISSFYDGQSKILRLIGNLIEGLKLIQKAQKINEGVIIVMTNPMLLNIWAGFILNRKKTPWIYWSMDLYPEGFASSHLIKKSNPIYKYFFRRAYLKKPNGMIALGDIQAKYLKDAYKKDIPTVILPCGVFLNNGSAEDNNITIPKWKTDKTKIYLGYIGNLGQAHSIEFIKWTIDHLQPENHHLMLVVYGAKAHIIKEYIKDKEEGITLLDYMPREELKHLDVNMVSLISEWVNVCVPSKMVSAVHQGSAVLFYGSKNCDSWQDHKDASWLIEEGKNAEGQIKEFLNTVTHDVIEEKKANAIELPKMMTENTLKAYHEIKEMVEKIVA